MALNDVSLTTGMRSNLLSLQGTVDLLNRTQNRLSSGKKVNTAIDNPVSFFASQALTARASTIDSLKDGMGQAIQTIQAADKGIKAITAMIEQAKGIGQAALSAAAGTGFDGETITLNSVARGQNIVVGATILTAGPTAIDTTYTSFTLTVGAGLTAGATVVVGGVTFMATTAALSADGNYTAATFTITNVATSVASDSVKVGGVTYTASTGVGGFDFTAGSAASLQARIAAMQGTAYTATVVGSGVTIVGAGGTTLNANSVVTGTNLVVTDNHTHDALVLASNEFLRVGTDTTDANALQGAIDAYFGTGLVHGVTGAVVTIQAGTMGLDATTVGTTLGAIAVSSATSTSYGALAATEFAWTGDDVIDAQALANLINGNTAIHTTGGYSATADNGVITLTNSLADIAVGGVTGTAITAGTMVETAVSADAELSNLVARYNVMRTQIDELADDSGYKGKNLLAGNTLVVQFEGTTLNVVGFNAKVGNLGISPSVWLTDGSTGIDADILELDAALSTIRQESSKLAGNLSIITVRNDFSTSMINTLIEGSDKLTLADSNEEGANMLMLQTRQTLATTALSLSAQAAQSVLRLFQ